MRVAQSIAAQPSSLAICVPLGATYGRAGSFNPHVEHGVSPVGSTGAEDKSPLLTYPSGVASRAPQDHPPYRSTWRVLGQAGRKGTMPSAALSSSAPRTTTDAASSPRGTPISLPSHSVAQAHGPVRLHRTSPSGPPANRETRLGIGPAGGHHSSCHVFPQIVCGARIRRPQVFPQIARSLPIDRTRRVRPQATTTTTSPFRPSGNRTPYPTLFSRATDELS